MKKTAAAAILAAGIVATLSMTGCAAWQQGMNTIDADMNGRTRSIEVYSLDGQKIADFDCRCTIEYDDGRVLFDDLDTNERTAIYGNSIVVTTEKVDG